MLVTLALIRQHLKDQRLTTLVWSAVVAFLSYTVVAMAPSVTADSFLLELAKSVPAPMARLFGDLFAYRYPVDAFLQVKWLLFMPVLTTVFGVLAAMRIVAREIDDRTADFALTLPITRSRFIAARFSALTIEVGILFVASYFMLWAGLALGDTEASLVEYGFFYTGAFCITLVFSALALWLSVSIEEYATAVRYALVIPMTMWTLHLASRTLGGPTWFDRALVFGWAETEAVIARSEFPWGAIAVGAPLTILFVLLAVRTLERKQIQA